MKESTTSVLRSAKRAPANVRQQYKMTSDILFSRRMFAGARFAERSTDFSVSDWFSYIIGDMIKLLTKSFLLL